MEYCRYSAAPVGRQLLDLHGEGRDTWPASDALCAALQVLNHLQDCADDYRDLDRVYLPLDDLDAAGCTVEALAAPAASPALRRVLDRLLDRTEALIATAPGLPPRVAARGLRWEFGGHRRAGWAAGAPAAARRSAGRPGQADQRRFRGRLPDRRVRAAAAMTGAVIGTTVGTGSRRRGAARDDSPQGRGRRDLVLLGDAAAAARSAATACTRSMRSAARSTTSPTTRAPARAEARGARRVARRRSRRFTTGRPRAPGRLAPCASRCARYALRREDFHAVIDGMEMDAAEDIRAPDMATLDLYCARVAARGRPSVGACVRRFERRRARGRRFARPRACS